PGAATADGKPIEVGRLSPIDPAWAGPLTVDQGGFPASLWRGTPRSFVAALLPRLPATTSPALQSLSRRLLLSNADAPGGGEPGGAADLIALRVDRLIAAGDVDAAQSLLTSLPSRGTVEGLERRSVELAFLAADPKPACARVGDDVRRFNGLWWTHALIACQALAGDHAKVALGLDLLHEQKAPKDAAFEALVSAPADRRVKLERLPDPSALDLALLAARKQPLPDDALATASPAVLRAWASAESAPPAQRLAAGERAAAFGALPIADLRSLYEKADFTADERAKPAAAAGKIAGARGHALLYAAAVAQTAPAARAELLRNLLEMARKDGSFTLVARAAE